MTKQVRDWQFDTQLCSKVKEIGHTDVSADIVKDIAIYWLQQYAAEKEQTELWREHVRNTNIELEAAEAREKKLQAENERLNTILKSIQDENERMLNGEGMDAYEEALASLYPKEEEAK